MKESRLIAKLIYQANIAPFPDDVRFALRDLTGQPVEILPAEGNEQKCKTSR